MIKRILSLKINTISSAAVLVAFSSLFSRLLGAIRDRVLAGQFGAGDNLDVYYAAFRAPDLVFNLIVLGALSAGFIPVFTKTLKVQNNDHEQAWKLANNVINTMGLWLFLVSVLAILFASPLAILVSPGFSPAKQAAVAALTRIMFVSPLLLGLSSIVGGILQSHKSFVAYSLAPIMYNFGVIIGVIFLSPIFGIIGLAWGVVIGASLHLAIQLPALYHLGYRYQAHMDLKSEKLKQITKMMIPRTMSLAIAQVDLLIGTAIASTLASGSLVIFNFANNLQFFPIGIFGISIATAAFPTFSFYAHDEAKLAGYFSKVVSQVLFFIFPATVFLYLLRSNLTHVILGVGNFDASALNLTNQVLACFLISLFAQAIIPVVVRVFYARENSRTPFYVGLISVIVDIFLAILLSRIYGIIGIALAFSVANIVNLSLLWLVLRTNLAGINERYILKTVLKSLFASMIAGLGIYLALALLTPLVGGHLVVGFISGLLGVILYFLVSLSLKSPEAAGVIDKFKKKLSASGLNSSDQGEARGI